MVMMALLDKVSVMEMMDRLYISIPGDRSMVSFEASAVRQGSGLVTMEIIVRHIFHRDMSQGAGFVGRIPLTW